jgi:superfamily II DNA or RNA helicase
MKLYPYQEKVLESIISDPSPSKLISMPTGTGKTITFLHVAKHYKKNTLILVHREELLNQTFEKALKIGFLEDDIAIINSLSKDSLKTLNISMVPSLVRNLDRYDPKDIDMIIVDEAHHATAHSYTQIFNYFDVFSMKKLLIGFTATPMRGDKKCLSGIFQSHCFKMTLQEATQSGYICPVYGCRIQLDKTLENIETWGGDYKVDQLDSVMNCESINELVAQRCANLYQVPALIFCTSIDHAKKICDKIKEKGRTCGTISYKNTKKEVDEIITKLKNKEIDFLTNAIKLTEGFDYPPIRSIISARPTKSPVLYKQMIGRGLRLSPEKLDCFVLEFTGTDPEMLCWDDIDENSTFESFSEEAIKTRKDAFSHYKNIFNSPNIKILDVRVSPFKFYECRIRRSVKYKKYFMYVPASWGFAVAEIRHNGKFPNSSVRFDLWASINIWVKEFQSFYVYTNGDALGSSSCFDEIKKMFFHFVDSQPEPMGKWYLSEEQPATTRQKKIFPALPHISARKAEMLIEDFFIKKAIDKHWIQNKMKPVDDGGKLDENTVIYNI